MKRIRRIMLTIFTFVLCLGLFLPMQVSAADLYFTALNERVELLTTGTMPFWSGRILYVPYTIFDKNLNSTQTDLGLNASYSNRTKNTVTVYNLQKMLVFDLDAGTCRDGLTGEIYPYKAVMRNGKPYLPLEMVCSFFGLRWSFNSLPDIPEGYLIRITNEDSYLDDASFIDAAGNLLQRRLQSYTQSLNPGENTTPVTPDPGDDIDQETEVTPTNIPTYLAVRCEDGTNLLSIANTLKDQGCYGVFFLPPQLIQQEDSLVRQLLGMGHSIGILAEGKTLSETRQLLEEGNQYLAQLALTRSTLAYVPENQQAALEKEGWVCWDETLLLSPSDTVGSSYFASSTLNQLSGRNRVTYLTLTGDANGARVLSTLLWQLSENHFILGIPLETRL